MSMGIMAYGSAFLWAIFLMLTSAEVIVQSLTVPVYFPFGRAYSRIGRLGIQN